MKRSHILIASALSLLLLVVIFFATYISYTNQEVRLSQAVESKIQANKSSYTKMWEIISLQAGVSQKYAEDFKSIYPDLIRGRYSNGNGQMMQWIQEHNPNFDTSLYQKVMLSIESQRESFHTNQEQLIDLNRQHSVLIKTFPGSLFLSGAKEIKIPVVINDEADKAFSSGKEQKMKLY